MIRNIPNNFNRDRFLQLLDGVGGKPTLPSFKGAYDFVYLPIDFKTRSAKGYAFVNFINPQWAAYFGTLFDKFSTWDIRTNKTATIEWNVRLQGFRENVHHYKNSDTMHEQVPDEFKPAIFVSGQRCAFPPADKEIKLPAELEGGGQRKTTLMLRNLPKDFTRKKVQELLDQHDCVGKYDFLYMPVDFHDETSKSFAFVNFKEADVAEDLRIQLSRKQANSNITAGWCKSQGYHGHVNRLRNNSVMHATVPEEFKPIVLEHGVPAIFPEPTKPLIAPELHQR